MMDFSGVFVLVYFLVIVAVVVYLIVLAGRFVDAHQRGAEALERISQTLRSPSRE